MRSFHPKQGLVANSQPSILCHGGPSILHLPYLVRVRLWKGGSDDNRGEGTHSLPPIQAYQLKLDEVLTCIRENYRYALNRANQPTNLRDCIPSTLG